MAYLRKEKETVEIDFPLGKVWVAIPGVLAGLEWTVAKTDEVAHRVSVKTKGGFLSYGSSLTIDVVAVGERVCRVSVEAETPVTTITSVADFGGTKRRIEVFLEALAVALSKAEKS